MSGLLGLRFPSGDKMAMNLVQALRGFFIFDEIIYYTAEIERLLD